MQADVERGAMVGKMCSHPQGCISHPPPPPLQASPARALEWEVPLEQLRPLVDAMASDAVAMAACSPGTIVSHGLEWRLKVQASPVASDAAAVPATATFIVNSLQFAVPLPPAACTLTGLSYRVEAARSAQPEGDAAAGEGGRRGQRAAAGAPLGPLSKEMPVSDTAPHNSGWGWLAFFPVLQSGSVDDPVLAPFVHTGPGGVKVLRLRVVGLGLE